jgi:hypothetical protein
VKTSRIILLVSLVWIALAGMLTTGRSQITLFNVGHTNNAPALRSYALGVTVVSNLVYLVNGTDGLRIYNVSDPANPINIGHGTNSIFYAQSVAVSGDHAYVVAGNLTAFEVSDPTNVVFLSQTNIDGVARGVAVAGNHAFVATYYAGLWAFDVSNPAQILNIAKTNNGGNAIGVTLAGNYCYLANAKDGVRIYDVSDPANPANVGHYAAAAATKVAVAGNRLYVANGGVGLSIADVTDITSPFQIGATNTGGYAQSIAISGAFAFVANGSDGLRVFDVSDPTKIVSVGHVNDGGTATDVVVVGHYLYLANFNDGLRIYKILPQLRIESLANGNLSFSWPAVAAFRLQQNTGLGATGWETVTNLPTLIGSRDQIVLPMPPGISYYRLTSE